MQVDITNRASKQLRKTTNPTRDKIKFKIKEIESTNRFDQLNAEFLKGQSHRYKIRIGNYRIILKKQSATHIEITSIANRKEIYNKLFSLTI